VTSHASSAGGASWTWGRAVTPLDEGGPNGALGMDRGDEAGGADARSASQGADCGAIGTAGPNRPVEEAVAIGRGGRWTALDRFCGGAAGLGAVGAGT